MRKVTRRIRTVVDEKARFSEKDLSGLHPLWEMHGKFVPPARFSGKRRMD